MNKSYVALHNHSTYSFLDGLSRADEWVKTAAKKGLGGIAITNHGEVGDLLEFYNAGKKHDFPVILGLEAYFVLDRKERDNTNRYSHLNLFVKNEVGYRNLCILASIGYTEDRRFHRPRIDIEDLRQYNEGLICTSACVGSLWGKLARNTEKVPFQELKENTELFLDIFKDDFYFEIQPADIRYEWNKETKQNEQSTEINPQETSNRIIIKLAKKYNIKIVASGDAHMLESEHKITQDIQIQNSPGNKDGWHFAETYCLESYDEFVNSWKQVHPYVMNNDKLYEYLDNTYEILEKCKDLKLTFPTLLPNVKKDANYKDLIRLINKKKIVDVKNPIIKDRIKKELDVLCNNGILDFTNYFLLLEDVINWCNENGILSGPGRGSAAGSLVCYALGITKVDPIRFNLSFERFINLTRIQQNTLPDIDIDFGNPSLVKEYIKNRYGKEYVANIGTIQTMALKSSIRDTLRVLGYSSARINEVSKDLADNTEKLENKAYLNTQIQNNKALQEVVKEQGAIKDIIPVMLGQVRQRGQHAAAIVVSPVPINTIVPLAISKSKEWVTQYSMYDVEKCGLVKYDILGLNTLNDINSCLNLVKERHEIDITVDGIIDNCLDDPKVMKQFQKGNTDTVFQFNTPVAKEIIKAFPIKTIQDLSDATAIGRTGVMEVGGHTKFINRANKKEKISYPHSSLENVLKNTYGLFVYQEQSMEAVQILANFTAAEADSVRRGMAKKKIELLTGFKKQFIEQSVSKYEDIDEESASIIWQTIEANAGYNFNKAHSISYAIIGYICQFLKTYYPLEWQCSVLINENNDDNLGTLCNKLLEEEKLEQFCVNNSRPEFAIVNEKVTMPLHFIKRVGRDTALEISKHQPYYNVLDFVKKVNRTKVKKDVIINLILAGAFKNIDKNKNARDCLKEFFDILASQASPKPREKLLEEYRTKFHHINKFKFEQLQRTVLPSTFASADYSQIYNHLYTKNKEVILSFADVKKKKNKSKVTILGLVDNKKATKTKNGDEMGYLFIDNGMGETLKTILWPETFKQYFKDIENKQLIGIKGSVNKWKETISIVYESHQILQ